MGYAAEAVERAMKKQEVILQGMSGKYAWWQVAEILDVSPRTVRRWPVHRTLSPAGDRMGVAQRDSRRARPRP